MNSNLITDIGENLEYIKTIVVNELEIKKLDFVDSGANIVSKIVSSALIFLFLFLAFITAIVTLTIVLSNYLGSSISALLIITGVLILLSVLLLVFRQVLIVNPITRIIYNLIDND